MTDFHPNEPRPDDELVTAVLDGEANDAERARVDADPALQERLAQFRAVSERMSASTVTATSGHLDRIRAAALEATSEWERADELGDEPSAAGGGTRPSGGAPPPPVPLAPRRRRPRSIELPSPAVAAAVLLVVALIGIGLVLRGGSDDGRSDTASAPTARAEAQDSPASPEATSPGDQAGPAPLSGSLGRFASQAELTRALAQLDRTTLSSRSDSALTTTTPAGPISTTAPRPSATVPAEDAPDVPSSGQPPQAAAVDRCDRSVRAVPGQNLEPPLAVAEAVLDDRPVLVYSHPQRQDDPAAPEVVLLTVVVEETCQILFAVQR